MEKDRVLNGGPWSFNKSLLVLREPGMTQPSKIKFETSAFWVRLYNLPLGARTKGMEKRLAESMGKLITIDEESIRVCGRFLRIRVLINITKPLRRGI